LKGNTFYKVINTIVKAILMGSYRILQDHTDSSGIHGQALDSLRQKLTEVEAALQREQEANRMSRVKYVPLI